MCLADGLPECDEVLPEQVPARQERRGIRPLTWIVAFALTPVLFYDVWQTVQDVKQRHLVRADQMTAALGSPATVRSPRIPD